MPSNYVPQEHELLRYVPWNKLRKDEDDNVLGVLGTAFKLRPNEEYLSGTWVGFFSGTRDQQICAAVTAFRNSNMSVSTKSGFAIGTARVIAETCARRSKKIRIIHEPEVDNRAHAALRGWPDDDDLLDLIADDSWGDVILNSSVP